MSKDTKKIPVILMIDNDNKHSQDIQTILKQEGMHVIFLSNSADFMKEVNHIKPHIILLNLFIQNSNPFELCQQLRENLITQDVPVIFIAPPEYQILEQFQKIELGAIDVCIRPLHFTELLRRIQYHLLFSNIREQLHNLSLITDRSITNSTMHILELQMQKIESLTLSLVTSLERATYLSDIETGQHVKRIGIYAERLSELIGCDVSYSKRIRLYAPLHDSGKIGISDILLRKVGIYTIEERELMQQHVLLGSQFLMYDKELDPMSWQIAKYHHEKWDGTGYLTRLKGEEIPLAARIVTIVDIYDALGTPRVYKPAFAEDVVEQIMQDGSGIFFDPTLIKIFLENIDIFRQIKYSFQKEE